MDFLELDYQRNCAAEKAEDAITSLEDMMREGSAAGMPLPVLDAFEAALVNLRDVKAKLEAVFPPEVQRLIDREQQRYDDAEAAACY